MPRLGIKKSDVIEAAEALMIRGQKLTVSNVRSQLGDRGSNTTISRLLNEWRLEALSGDIGTDNELGPDEEIEKLTKDNEQLHFELRELLEENAKLKSELKFQKTQNEIGQGQIASLKTELEKYHSLYIDIKEEREHFLTKHTQKLEDEKSRLEAELKNLHERFDEQVTKLRYDIEEKRVALMMEEYSHKENKTKLESESRRVKSLEQDNKLLTGRLNRISGQMDIIVEKMISDE